jgi:putative ABC transport system ATP-binding protein
MYRLDAAAKTFTQGDRTVAALRPATFQIAPGELVAVVGKSGSGKSTLLALLGGMLAPSEGQVLFEGCSLYDLTPAARAELRRLRMGFVFQSFNLVPYLSAQENVEVPLLLCSEPRHKQRARARQLLELVGLSDRADHKPCELSAGQQQRVALARTLANDPPVILADEPTGNLDPETRNAVLGFFDDLHRAGKTIIVVTHDPLVAARATRRLELADGALTDRTAAGSRAA